MRLLKSKELPGRETYRDTGASQGTPRTCAGTCLSSYYNSLEASCTSIRRESTTRTYNDPTSGVGCQGCDQLFLCQETCCLAPSCSLRGHFFLSFGNAWKGGKVKVFKNNELQATAGRKDGQKNGQNSLAVAGSECVFVFYLVCLPSER